eukprot:gene5082-6326_t
MPSELLSELTIISPSIEDLPYEDDVAKNQYSLTSWLRYLEFKLNSTQKERNYIYERALRELPRSYKLWHQYLKERVLSVRGKCIVDPSYESINNLFERSLVFLDKMPRIWIEYCQFLMIQEKITQTRRTFDRALRSLPITQHPRIWELYLKFIKKVNIPEVSIKIYKRYLKIQPEMIEEYIEYLIEMEAWNEASLQLINIVNQDKFQSTKGKTRHQLWLQLCDILASHPKDVKGIKVDAIIRSGIQTFTDQVGKLWSSLADYYIQLAQFDKARDIYEEALNTVSTARDFSHIWESYTQFEDSLIVAKQEVLADLDESDTKTLEEESLDFDMMVERYEHLVNRQPLLLNSVLLRQNPNNVQEWHKRVKLYSKYPKMIVETYSQALKTVDPQLAKGKFYTLWASFAQYYESHNKLEQARKIFESGVKVNYKTIDDLSSIWCEYAEMELRHKNYERALDLLKRATISPRKLIKISDSEPVQKRLFKSTKLWTFYVDLEESYGSFHNTKSIYDKMIQLKVVTPQIILNYAAFLEENNYYEDSFKAYEQGVMIFPFPHAKDIWISYLTKFIQRYGGLKLERARDLFEQVLLKCPTKDSKIFYLMYANLEEQYGLARHSMAVYDRACRNVAQEDRFNLYLLYISRASEFFGVTQTREIFTKAIELLTDNAHARDMCLRFADMERKYGEIDRARSIYIHGAQFSDPRIAVDYWNTWIEFERSHGNSETFTEMLRVKKSVQAQYSIQSNLLDIEKMNAMQKAELAEKIRQDQEQKQQAEKEKEKLAMENIKNRMGPTPMPPTRNDEEIDIDMDDEDDEQEEDEGPDIQIEQKQIPDSVFGSNIKK